MSVIAEAGLTVEQVAALFGVTTRTIARWQNDEREPLPVRQHGSGQQRTAYDPRAVFLWALKRQDADSLSLERERVLNLRADTRLKELKAQQLLNELAPIDLLNDALTAIAIQIAALLAEIPQTIRHASPTLAEADIAIVQREIEKCKAACAAIRAEADITKSYESDNMME